MGWKRRELLLKQPVVEGTFVSSYESKLSLYRTTFLLSYIPTFKTVFSNQKES